MLSTSEVHDALIAHEPTIERRYVDAALVEIDRRPQLLECYPPSVVASVAISEALGIPVDSRVGAAFLSVERQKGSPPEALFLPGYPAFDIAMRAGDPEILFTDAQIVHERDDFRFEHSSGQAVLVPSRPKLSRILSGLAAVAGIASPDGFRHVPYLGVDAGPVVAIYACAYYRNGSVKRALMLRRDFEGVTPETPMEEEASEARNWGERDRLQKLLGLALKRLAKTLQRTPEMGVLIYLSRGGERARYTPRSLDACRTLGVVVVESPASFRGVDFDAAVEERAKEVDDEKAALEDAGFERVVAVCCECLKPKQTRGYKDVRLSVECPTKCTFVGRDHRLCGPCFRRLCKKASKEASAKTPASVPVEPATGVPPSAGAENSAAPAPPPSLSEGMGVTPGSSSLAPDEAEDSELASAGGSEATSSLAEVSNPGKGISLSTEGDAGQLKAEGRQGSLELGPEASAAVVDQIPVLARSSAEARSGIEPSTAAETTPKFPREGWSRITADEVCARTQDLNLSRDFAHLLNTGEDTPVSSDLIARVQTAAQRSSGKKAVDLAHAAAGGKWTEDDNGVRRKERERGPLTALEARKWWVALISPRRGP